MGPIIYKKDLIEQDRIDFIDKHEPQLKKLD
jgi:hypothetical protein